jgi:hypothetical protein
MGLALCATSERKEGTTEGIDASELKEARDYWIREVQREHFGPELQALQEGVSLSPG